jgi:uncharacterized protein (TIGR03067 family)
MTRNVVAVVVAVVAAAAATAADEKKPLEGKWTVESVTRDGKPDDGLKGATRVHQGDKYTVTPAEGSKAMAVVGTFTIDPTTKSIDMKPTSGRYKDKTLLGIYKLDGDKLTVAFAEPGKDRPKDFEVKEGTGVTVAVHKKVK